MIRHPPTDPAISLVEESGRVQRVANFPVACYPPSEQLTTLTVALWPMECVWSPFSIQFAIGTSRTRHWLLIGSLMLDSNRFGKLKRNLS